MTGSSGLVGVPLCDALRTSGHRVDEFDLRPPPGRAPSEPFEAQDIRDSGAVESAITGVDGVVHLAAVARCGAAEAEPELARSVNVGGTRTLLSALQSNERTPWLLFASSREVYGDVRAVPVPETSPLQPKAVYGRTKADAEAEIQRSRDAVPRSVSILRFTNLYGSPWDYPDRVIPAFLRRAKSGAPLEVRGPDQVLDFLDVRDAVRAVVRAVTLLASSVDDLGTTNVASGRACTLRALADQVVELTGSPSPIHEVAPAAWTPSIFVADIARARRTLGWEPTIPLPRGLADLSAAFDTLRPVP
ncbi:MAG: NAD(P)-dependent oxidoreductase [Thermoplasmata archaeon]|nr:NAD(P)-dependent oxidoreductase [Thermoplasmata archaeon]